MLIRGAGHGHFAILGQGRCVRVRQLALEQAPAVAVGGLGPGDWTGRDDARPRGDACGLEAGDAGEGGAEGGGDGEGRLGGEAGERLEEAAVEDGALELAGCDGVDGRG